MSRLSRRPRPALRGAVLLVLALSLTLVVPPPRVSAAASAPEAEAMLLSWVNTERSARSLVPLVRWHALAVVAGRRATRMAELNTASHSAAGDLAAQLKGQGVTWYRMGENVGYSGAAWTVDAAKDLFRMWKASPMHWSLLMSDRFNYVGVGLAYRSSNQRTFGSVVFTESADHSGARARVTSETRSGDDVRWTWTGSDRRLQTHTAGLRDFDVQYRVNSGDWRTVRNDTTAMSITLKDRVRGRYYSIRVRATDRRGNVGAWTSASKIWVP
ncbi:hypothetical protein BH20CHL7_BH20CHL7_10740 [soil metagenome]